MQIWVEQVWGRTWDPAFPASSPGMLTTRRTCSHTRCCKIGHIYKANNVKETSDLPICEELLRIPFLQKLEIPGLLLLVSLLMMQMNCCFNLVTIEASHLATRLLEKGMKDEKLEGGRGLLLRSPKAIFGSQSSWCQDFQAMGSKTGQNKGFVT